MVTKIEYATKNRVLRVNFKLFCVLRCICVCIFAALRCHVVEPEDPVVDGSLASEACPQAFEVVIPDVVHCCRTQLILTCAGAEYLALLINSWS